MFHSRCLNNKIKERKERCLRLIYNDKLSNLEELLNEDNSACIQHNNIHTLTTELYKNANEKFPKIMIEVFKVRDTPYYNLQHTP